MDPKYYQTKEFTSLKKKWYKTLKKSGFVDAEQDEIYLNQSSTSNRSGGSESDNISVVKEAKESYHIYAEHFKNTPQYTSLTLLDQAIWDLHAEGHSYRTIAEELKKKDHKSSLNKDHINRIVLRIKQEMFKVYGVTAKK